MGTANARVFPEPVVASTSTSLWFKNKGIVADCTGVIFMKPNPPGDDERSASSTEELSAGTTLEKFNADADAEADEGADEDAIFICRICGS